MPQFQSATSGLVANPLFQVAMEGTDVEQFKNVLGFTLESFGRRPLEQNEIKHEIEYIAQNAAKIANDLIENNVYDQPERTYERLGRLMGSTKADVSNGKVRIYSDAQGPNGYPYAGSIEYGYHPWQHAASYIPPRPFLRPALEFAANATRASLEENIKQMLINYRNNNFAFSHFGNSFNTVGVSKRYWGRTVGNRFDIDTQINIDSALANNRGNYGAWKNAQRYGTQRGAYKSVWNIQSSKDKD